MKAVLLNHRFSPERATKFHVSAERERTRKRYSKIEKHEAVSLRRFATITFQQSTELLLATNLRAQKRFTFHRGFRSASLPGFREQLIIDPLVRSLGQIETEPGFYHAVEMSQAKEQKVVQAAL